MKALLLLPLLALPARAEFFSDAASGIARIAPRARVRFVSVRSFTSSREGGTGLVGEALAERLVAKMVHLGRPAVLHAGPKVDLPDAFVTGTYLRVGSGVAVTINVASAMTGTVLYSVSGTVPDEWSDAQHAAVSAAPRPPPVVREDPCEDWTKKVDEMQARVLEAKARYWARKLFSDAPKKAAVGVRPGKFISDKRLYAEFDRSLRFWMSQRSVPKLTPAEVKAFVDADLKSELLARECGGSGALAGN